MTLPSPHLGFSQAGFHAPPIVGFCRCGAPLKVHRISYSLGLWQSHVVQPSPRLQSGRVSYVIPRGVGRCGAPLKVRRISYGLGLWQSYVAQPPPRLQSGGVSCAVPRGIWQMRLVAKLHCPAITSASVGQGFMRRPSRGWQMPSSLKLLGISYGLGLWQSHVAQPSPRLQSGRVSCAVPRRVDRCGAPARCAASPTASACSKATLPSPHLGFSQAGFHAPPLAGFDRCSVPLKVRRISYGLGL